ncbi:MAG: hypothetical protein ACOVO3_03270 [Fluviicola sp.]|jgi:hypothetical protein
MAKINHEFIYWPNAKIVGANHAVGTFVGFKDQLLFIPDKIDEAGYRKDTIHTYTFKGKKPSEFVKEVVDDTSISVDQMKEVLSQLLPEKFEYSFMIENYKRFKVSISWIPALSSILLWPNGRPLPFQVVIKDKAFLNQAKAFYDGMFK